MPEPTTHEVRAGQTYARVNRAERSESRIRVVEYQRGAERAVVVDGFTGKRRRETAVAKLRPAGPPSSTVWRLITDAPVIAGPCKPPNHSTATVSPCECEDQCDA